MIIGRTQSADGGFRRIPVRHTQIVDQETRKNIINYLKDVVYQKCENAEWVGASDLFPNIPEDLMNTPLKVLCDICSERFRDNPNSIRINISKYLGMLVREAVYYSEVQYFEQMMGSVRKYSLKSKNLSEINYKKSREKVLTKSYIRVHLKSQSAINLKDKL